MWYRLFNHLKDDFFASPFPPLSGMRLKSSPSSAPFDSCPLRGEFLLAFSATVVSFENREVFFRLIFPAETVLD